jgi:hypothetical protein
LFVGEITASLWDSARVFGKTLERITNQKEEAHGANMVYQAFIQSFSVSQLGEYIHCLSGENMPGSIS